MIKLILFLKLIILIFTVTILLFIIHKILKSHKPFWNALKSSLSGVIVLVAISLMSDFTNIYIPLSLMNIGISSLAGIPGVCMLMTANFIFEH